MDRVTNPFAPGAGVKPPELAGRSGILEDARVALARNKTGRFAKSKMLLGLRGVGKTVLLNRLSEMAVESGHKTIILEAPEDRKLAGMLVPPLRSLLVKMSMIESAKEKAKKGLGMLRAFASVFKVGVGDMEFGVSPISGEADTGSLESDLPELLLAVATASKAADAPVVLLIDEAQYLSKGDLSALIASVHKVGQSGLPFLLFGAGLPQLAALSGEAKSYAERLFDYPEVGALSPDAAKEAILAPILREGASINEDAVKMIIEKTQGYPYFLQEWGSHAWNEAERSPITLADVDRATTATLRHLDLNFFRVRLDRLTPRESEYMRAMAELGPGPHRSGEIAEALRMDVTAAGPLRSGLIKKGMIYSPRHGDTAFTVPMFGEFMCRAIQNFTPNASVATETRKTGKGKN